MASRTKRAKTQNNSTEKNPRKFVENASSREENGRGFFDYFRFGESYTSLILGIVVVIITAILLVTFVRNRNIGQISNSNKQVSTISTVSASPTPTISGAPSITKAAVPTSTVTQAAKPTVVPTKAATPTVTKAAPTKTPTIVPTKVIAKAPTATVTQKPTSAPKATSTPKLTSTPRPTNTVAPTKTIAKATPQPVQNPQKGKTYTVRAGDTLWSIAERTYKSGYNWVDIAKANKLANPGVIAVGTQLTLPDVKPITLQAATELKPQASVTGAAITGNTYTVVKGDYLWDISIRAYGTGFKYAELVKANKITNPGLIYAGTKLNIPRPK